MIKLILARSLNNVIGADGTLPWHLPEDLKRFKELTTGHIVVMGRKTWESLPATVKPLSNRTNVVITSDHDSLNPKPHSAYSLPKDDQAKAVEGVLASIAMHGPGKDIWIIGGNQTYNTFLPYVDEIYETVVAIEPEGDTFGIDPTADLTKFQKTVSPLATPGWATAANGMGYRFNIYARVNLSGNEKKPWDPV